jgi:hypothetical protein
MKKRFNCAYTKCLKHREYAKEAKSEKEAASSTDDADYEMGYLMAFHEVIDVMKEQAKAFNIE